MSEVARGAEDHNRAWLRHGTRRQTFAQWIWFRLISSSVHGYTRYADFRRLGRQKIGPRQLFWSAQRKQAFNIDFILVALGTFAFNQSLQIDIWNFYTFDDRFE